MAPMTWHERYSELDCLRNGDPFWIVIIKGDDLLVDYRYNFELLGLTQDEAMVTVLWVEREQLSFELECLERWWRL
jgi:hypothetical protein